MRLPTVIHHPLALAPGDRVPPLSGRTHDGQAVSVDWAAHRATLVNFWATWCAPCKIEMPALQTIASDRGEDGVAVYGVLVDDVEDAAALEHLASLGVTYPSLRLSLRDLTAWGGGSVLPVTFLVDANGKVIRRYVGASEAQAVALAEDVAAFLEGRPLGTQPFPVAEDDPGATPQD